MQGQELDAALEIVQKGTAEERLALLKEEEFIDACWMEYLVLYKFCNALSKDAAYGVPKYPHKSRSHMEAYLTAVLAVHHKGGQGAASSGGVPAVQAVVNQGPPALIPAVQAVVNQGPPALNGVVIPDVAALFGGGPATSGSKEQAEGNVDAPQIGGAGERALRVSKRIGGKVLENILLSGSKSVETEMKLMSWREERSKWEAIALGRVIDLLIDQLNSKGFLELKASETLMRRLAALMMANASTDKNPWVIARHLEETYAGVVPVDVMAEATKAANTERKAKGLSSKS
jgi:hypothetical protein